MGWFSFGKKKSAEKNEMGDIPPEIFSAIRVMSDRNTPKQPGAPVVSSEPQTVSAKENESPFLQRPSSLSSEDIVIGREENRERSLLPQENPEQSSNNQPLQPKTQASAMKVKAPGKPHIPKKILFGGVGALIVVLFGSGIAWYFLVQKSEPQAENTVDLPPETPVALPEPAPKALPYAVDKPNYLSLDVETVTAEEIERITREAALQIAEAGITSPVEFLMTDKKNNPLAFSRLAYLLKLDVPSDLLAQIEEVFSLYVYNVNGQPRLGAVLELKDATLAKEAITKYEADIPKAFRPLLFGSGIAVPEKAAFRSGEYQGQPVRFVNIDGAQNVSLDYALRGKEWYLGNSKEVLHVILDAKRQ